MPRIDSHRQPQCISSCDANLVLEASLTDIPPAKVRELNRVSCSRWYLYTMQVEARLYRAYEGCEYSNVGRLPSQITSANYHVQLNPDERYPCSAELK